MDIEDVRPVQTAVLCNSLSPHSHLVSLFSAIYFSLYMNMQLERFVDSDEHIFVGNDFQYLQEVIDLVCNTHTLCLAFIYKCETDSYHLFYFKQLMCA